MLRLLRCKSLILLLTLLSPEALSQMQLSDDGRGEVLLFPFYSAASGEETNFVIHNHESHAKALYLRFREGLSGAEVLAFHLYLGPNDSFEGAVILDPNGSGAAVATMDSSCTVPVLGDSSVLPYQGFSSLQPDGRVFRVQPFFPWSYSEEWSGYPVTKDSNTDIRRTLVGSLEVIEMGQWGSAQSPGFFPSASVSAEVLEDIETRDCDALMDRWVSTGGVAGEWVGDPRAGALDWVGGGVSGELIITTPLGDVSYPPFVIENFARDKQAGEYHVTPGVWEGPWPIPSLANGSLSVRSPANGSVITAASGLDAVAILLAKTEVGVGSSDGSLSSERAVIVTFPTKWHHTNLEFLSDSGEASSSVGEPFKVDWSPSTSSACEAVGLVAGSATAASATGVVSQQLCGAINILNFPSASGLLASEADWLSTAVTEISEYPWAISFADAAWDDGHADERLINANGDQSFLGMPVAVMPLAVSVEGKWVREADVSEHVQAADSNWSLAGTGSGNEGTTVCEGDYCSDPAPNDETSSAPDSAGVIAGDSAGDNGTGAGSASGSGSGDSSSDGTGEGYCTQSTVGFGCSSGADSSDTSSNDDSNGSADSADDGTCPIGFSPCSDSSSDSSDDSGTNDDCANVVGYNPNCSDSSGSSSGSGSSGSGTASTGSGSGSSGSDSGSSSDDSSSDAADCDSWVGFGCASSSDDASDASGADTSLRVNLEEPAVDLVHMGIGNLRGWAISSAGIRKVEAFLDGELLGEIPYGGAREDVGRVFPDIDDSDQSGFSMSFNYSGLSAGTHTIEVVAHSFDNKTASDSAQFETVRFDKEFIGAGEVVNLNAAASVLTNDQIRVENISIAGKYYNLLLRWRTAEQGFEIVEIEALD